MAITQGDGSIVLTTKVDESGIKKGTRNLRSEAMKLAAEYRKAGMSQSEAQKRAYKELGVTTKETEKAKKATKEYGEEAEKAGDKASRSFSSLANGLKSVGKTALKASLAIGAVAGAAIVALTKQAVSAYADDEQLVGGIETLFKSSSKKIIEYSNEAYKTAGVSANEYMKTAISVSASLIQSLGGDTAKAADIANMAIVDMSDNVNKLGTDAERVKLAYAGFARQQYVLLDNLAIGYSGTKTEMERLLKDAQAITGIKYDINNLADVYTAIHVIQEQLGIAGTTAKEAEKTISGSAKAMKAAWQDLMVALASGEGIEKAIDKFVSSLSSFGANIIPVIKRTMDGLGRAFRELMPDLVKMIVSALIEAIPVILETIWEMIVAMFEGIVEGVKSLFTTEEDVYTQSQQQISNATKNQNKFTEAVEKTNEALEGTLADFDELNVLNSKEEKDLGLNNNLSYKMPDNLFEQSKKNAEEMEEAVKSTIFEVGKFDQFRYELIAEVDPNMVLNLQNSLLKAKTSIEELFSGEDGDGGFDFTSIVSNHIDMVLRRYSGAATVVAGISDIGVGVKENDLRSAWQGLGEIIQGGMQFNTSLSALFGIDKSEIDAWFYPIQEELENLYKGMTPVQMAQLESFKDIFDVIVTEFSEIAFLDSVIEEKDVTIIKKRFNNLKKVVTANSEAIKKEVVKRTSNLVKQGLMTEEEASQIVKDTEKVQQEQVDNIANAQAEIYEILQKASSEKRALTKEQEAEIALILQNAEDTYTAIVSEGTGDRQEILDKMEEYRDNMSTQRLSQLIVAANAEEKARKEAADKEYEETVEAARVLYEDLGTIDKKRYDEIVKNAKDERDAKYKEATESRNELVKEATLAAGEIANTVDPETGEIYSKWELLWDIMYNKMFGTGNLISDFFKGIINGLVDALNWVIDKINFVTGPFSNAEWFFGTKLPDYTISKIPHLAQGAVIPGGREFLAVLGDQPQGQTNIEAPLDTIKQALAEVLAQVNVNNGDVPPIIINVDIDGKNLLNIMRSAEDRYGNQIITGGFANA